MSNFVSDIETTDQMENEFIVLNHVSKEVPHSLLATLQVRVRDGRGMLVPIRIMIPELRSIYCQMMPSDD